MRAQPYEHQWGDYEVENSVIEPGHDDEPVVLCHEMVQPNLGVDVQVLLGRPQPGGTLDRRPARPDDKDLDKLVQGVPGHQHQGLQPDARQPVTTSVGALQHVPSSKTTSMTS